MRSGIQKTDENKQKKILLGQLGRRGDCLFATTIARQIKYDYPDSHLTWAISTMCRAVIEDNPYIDQIWEIPLKTNEEIVSAWKEFEKEALKRKNDGIYDEIYLTQVHPGNMQNYDGTSRTSLFRCYPRRITVPIEPVVRLSEEEINNVRRFVDHHQLNRNNRIILFECASTSGQSRVDGEFALGVARSVQESHPDVIFILSSNIPVSVADSRIIDGSVLSFKENAELTKYCCLLVGCSSGISWLATSDWAKPLPKIQILNKDTLIYASMMHDAVYFGLPTEQILELHDSDPERVMYCIQTFLHSGFIAAKSKYHNVIPIDFRFYFKQLYWELLNKNDVGKAAGSLSVTLNRFGHHPQLNYFINNIFFSYVELIWPNLSKNDLEQIKHIGYAPDDKPIQRSLKNRFKLFKAWLRKDTRQVCEWLIRKIGKRFFYV